MTRIFLMLAACSTLLIVAAFALGMNIQDASSLDEAARSSVRWHMLTALAALFSASLVHAIWLTYFMGTGRWMEETCRAYDLSDEFQKENQSMKFGTMLAVFGVFLLLLYESDRMIRPRAQYVGPQYLETQDLETQDLET